MNGVQFREKSSSNPATPLLLFLTLMTAGRPPLLKMCTETLLRKVQTPAEGAVGMPRRCQREDEDGGKC